MVVDTYIHTYVHTRTFIQCLVCLATHYIIFYASNTIVLIRVNRVHRYDCMKKIIQLYMVTKVLPTKEWENFCYVETQRILWIYNAFWLKTRDYTILQLTDRQLGYLHSDPLNSYNNYYNNRKVFNCNEIASLYIIYCAFVRSFIKATIYDWKTAQSKQQAWQ